MTRWAVLAIATSLLVGCQTARSPSDPFLRTTVPPPMTGQYAPPPPAYYTPGATVAMPAAGAPVMAAAPTTPAPVYGTAPPTYASPSPAYGTATPTYAAPAPAYSTPPAAAPPAGYSQPPASAAPPASAPNGPNRYAPSGGFNFPQSSVSPANAAGPGGAASGAGVALARNGAAQSRLIRSPTGPTADPAAGAAPSSAPAEDAVAPAVAIVPQLATSGVEQASFSQAVSDATAGDAAAQAPPDAEPPAVLPASRIRVVASDAPASSANQAPAGGTSGAVAPGVAGTNALAGVPEITDLPAANGSDTLRAYGPPQSRLVYTRANRPLSSPMAVADADAAQFTGAPLEPAGASGASYGATADYGTLHGRLEYSATLRQWKLRYIPSDGQTDAYGGSVLLPASDALQNFKPGDFVVAQGIVSADGPKRGFSPAYQLDKIAAQ